jgi:hypothetical protein
VAAAPDDGSSGLSGGSNGGSSPNRSPEEGGGTGNTSPNAPGPGDTSGGGAPTTATGPGATTATSGPPASTTTIPVTQSTLPPNLPEGVARTREVGCGTGAPASPSGGQVRCYEVVGDPGGRVEVVGVPGIPIPLPLPVPLVVPVVNDTGDSGSNDVGGLDNAGWDLAFNTFGSALAAVCCAVSTAPAQPTLVPDLRRENE